MGGPAETLKKKKKKQTMFMMPHLTDLQMIAIFGMHSIKSCWMHIHVIITSKTKLNFRKKVVPFASQKAHWEE